MNQTVNYLSKTTRYLHAIIALGMIGLLALGIYMTEFEDLSFYGLHKSLGVIILVFAAARIVWRIRKGWPEALSTESAVQLMVAKVVHWALILSTVLYPISGIMMSGAGGYGVAVFGLTLIDANVNAAGEVVPLNENIAGIGHEMHELMTWVLIAIIVLHVAGAIKHHIMDKDDTLKRMSPLG